MQAHYSLVFKRNFQKEIGKKDFMDRKREVIPL